MALLALFGIVPCPRPCVSSWVMGIMIRIYRRESETLMQTLWERQKCTTTGYLKMFTPSIPAMQVWPPTKEKDIHP